MINTPDTVDSTDDDSYSISGEFELLARKRRVCPELAADAAIASKRLQEILLEDKKKDTIKPSKTRRGRPPVTQDNPISDLTAVLTDKQQSWFNDIVYGSIASSVSASNGQLNVRISDVCKALHLKVISVASIKKGDMSDRSAQSIAQAARHAAKGIDLYLSRNPELRTQLTKELELAQAFA